MSKRSLGKNLDYYENEEFFDKHVFPHFIEECRKRGGTFSKDEGKYFILFKKSKPVKVLVDSGEIDRYYKKDRAGLKCSENFPDGEKSPCGYFIEGALPGYSYLHISFSEYSIGYDWDLKEFLRSVPNVDRPPIKVSVVLEKQKHNPGMTRQMTFDDLKKDKDLRLNIEEHSINVIGMDLDTGDHKILTALQMLLSSEIRRGALPKGNEKSFTLYVSKPQFFDSYGVGKSMSARGKMEYHYNESVEAMKNLRAFRDRRFLLIYPGKDRAGKQGLIKTVTPLIGVKEHYDKDKLGNEGLEEIQKDGSPVRPLKELAIDFHSIFTADLNSKYILKPANYLQEIELASGADRPSRYAINFIDYLFITYRDIAVNKGKPVKEIGYKILAERLRMDGFIQKRQWKRIKDKLGDCCELAKKLKYLTYYKIESIDAEGYEEKIILHLNIDKLGKHDEKGRKRIQISAPGG